ncbi:EamA family transporter, partial [Streptomyces sp. SID10692]|nr:EamA family transporter [Streptomyces sp. SID10692]
MNDQRSAAATEPAAAAIAVPEAVTALDAAATDPGRPGGAGDP